MNNYYTIEELAQLLYHNSNCVNEEDYIQIYGKPREAWENLDNWHRESYRFQARAASDFIIKQITSSMHTPVRCPGLDYKEE
jgi:hypothetical protein